MCGMYVINGVHGPEPRSSGGNTSSKPQVLTLIPRPVFNGMERMCQCHGSNQNSHPLVVVQKPLCNQFIHYHISSRGVFGINHFKLCNFVELFDRCTCLLILDMGGGGGFSKVVANFNHVDESFNIFMATTGDVWIIPSFWISGYVPHAEHISCVVTNCGQHQ